jgi:PleD family two-component response regulator
VIYLPRSTASDANEAVQKSSGSSWDYSGHETILVVDDEALCDHANEILPKHGYKVMCALGSEKALEILKTKAVDLLFSIEL